MFDAQFAVCSTACHKGLDTASLDIFGSCRLAAGSVVKYMLTIRQPFRHTFMCNGLYLNGEEV